MQATPNDLDGINKGGMIFYQITLIFFILISSTLSIKKIINLSNYNYLGTSICACNLLANLFMFIYAIDPLGYWRKYTRWDLLVVAFIGSGLMYITFILISIYFSIIIVKLLNTRLVDYGSKILFSIILLAEISLDISTIVFYLNYTYDKLPLLHFQYWRTAMSCIISFYYLTGGSYFLFKIKSFFTLKTDKKKKRYTQYFRLGLCIIILGVIMIMLAIVSGLFTNQTILNSPSGLLGELASFSLANSFTGIIFYWMFVPKKNDNSLIQTSENFSKTTSQTQI
eukprot:TRINITY_DN1435_c0_g1_i9.p1 TRINITY_DN1435_c0_g1~~TRINITY_DN1435_c0_g1_i9.p1  ORF type:complete len:283 (+),score=51.16 TRINITY_DN1435_c0_g1_i9:205-1053(+)